MEPAEEHLASWRQELLSEASGTVVEIGAGTGVNLPFYGEGVDKLILTEPDYHMLRELQTKVGPIRDTELQLLPRPADALGFEDGSVDTVVSTLVLCSVPDLERSLLEIRRVLRPGGRFIFLEHVAATHRPGRLRWQYRLEPLWRRVAGNCHLTRRTGDAIEDAGFLVEMTRESMRKAMPIVRTTVRGVATAPGPAQRGD